MRAASDSTPRCCKVVFFTLLSACTVAALQTVGACLVIAMVVTPGATAYLLTDRFGRLIVISVAIGVATSFVGAYISYFIDGATGGVIVTLQTLLFVAAFFLAPKHGVAGGPAPDRRRGSRRMTPLEWITVPLSYPFMQRALVVSVIVGAVCAVLSCYLVLKGWSLMGDAISHAVLPGIVTGVHARPAARTRRLRGRALLRAAHRLSEGEQPREGGHRDGHRVLRHVRVRAGDLLQDRDRPAPAAHPVRQRARRDGAGCRSRPRSSPAARFSPYW